MSLSHNAPLVKSPVFALPETFDAKEALPSSLQKWHDEANWLVSTVVRKMAYRKTDAYGYARLHSSVLRAIMSRRKQPAIISAMIGAGVLDPLAPYFVGVKSKGYRLAAPYWSQRCKLVRATDRKLFERIRQEQARLKEEQQARWLPIHRELAELQWSLSIQPEADTILESLPREDTRLKQSYLIEHIRQRQPRFSVSTTGRVFHWLTGLKRELREAVRLEGEPIQGVDISAAQPALLAVLMRALDRQNVPTYKHDPLEALRPSGAGVRRGCCLPSSVPPSPGADFARFEESVLSGCLYDRLVESCASRGEPLSRKAVKKSVLRDVLAKKGRYRCLVEDVFAAEYPSVLHFIRWANQYDHGQLIRVLQRLESWLVIENVAPRLVGRIPIVTLHDAIYSRERDTPIVLDTFQETFEETGIHLVVKPEPRRVGRPNVGELSLSA